MLISSDEFNFCISVCFKKQNQNPSSDVVYGCNKCIHEIYKQQEEQELIKDDWFWNQESENWNENPLRVLYYTNETVCSPLKRLCIPYMKRLYISNHIYIYTDTKKRKKEDEDVEMIERVRADGSIQLSLHKPLSHAVDGWSKFTLFYN